MDSAAGIARPGVEPLASARPGSVAVLGSTGSVGVQTLSVIEANPDLYKVEALAAGSNVECLALQVKAFEPPFVAVRDEQCADALSALVRRHSPDLLRSVTVGCGPEALERAVSLPAVHTVMGAVVGFASLRPVLTAIEQGKHIALANKECLVAGGHLVMRALQKSRTALVPVDSEHSSIYQCILRRGECDPVRRIILTASGGPFLTRRLEELTDMLPEDAVKHPRWRMGAKISVDSATLMNKGLEVIEAAVLFGLPPEKVEVLIHPESVVHGFVEFEDGVMLAALFETDMRVPIAFALAHLRSEDPRARPGASCRSTGVPYLDLAAKGALHFQDPDHSRFPALGLAYRALRSGGGYPAVLNGANEVAVTAFLQGHIRFTDIAVAVSDSLSAFPSQRADSLEDIIRADAWGRAFASEWVEARL